MMNRISAPLFVVTVLVGLGIVPLTTRTGFAQDEITPALLKVESADVTTPLTVLEKEVCGESFAVTGSVAVWTTATEGKPRFHEGKRISASRTTE